MTLDRSQFAALTSPAHIIYTGRVKTVTKASLKWSLNSDFVPTPNIFCSRKKISWDFIDLDNRNLTTRFGSDLSVVSRIKPLFDCYVRTIRLTISDWHKAITWLWQFPSWSRLFIRHLRQNWRKLEHVEGVWTLLMIMTGSFQDSRGEGGWLLRGRKWRYF